MDGGARLRRAGRGRGMPDEACRAAGGLWGVEASGLLAGLWPRCNAAEGLDVARGLQEQVHLRTGRTVTIGVAAHPTLDYAPLEALENARKAAEQCRFFRAEQRVAFDAVSLNISGDTCYERGDIPAAIHEFQKALQLDPKTSTSTTASRVLRRPRRPRAGAGGVCACALLGERRVTWPSTTWV